MTATNLGYVWVTPHSFANQRISKMGTEMQVPWQNSEFYQEKKKTKVKLDLWP